MILGFNKLLACSLDETMDIDDSLVDAHNLLDRLEGEFGHNNHMRDMDETNDRHHGRSRRTYRQQQKTE